MIHLLGGNASPDTTRRRTSVNEHAPRRGPTCPCAGHGVVAMSDAWRSKSALPGARRREKAKVNAGAWLRQIATIHLRGLAVWRFPVYGTPFPAQFARGKPPRMAIRHGAHGWHWIAKARAWASGGESQAR